RDVDTAATGIGADVADDIRQLERDAEVHRVVTSVAVGVTEDLDGRQPHGGGDRSEEHTSELQSRFDLVCRLLLEKKKETACQTGDRHILTSYGVCLLQDRPLQNALARSILRSDRGAYDVTTRASYRRLSISAYSS